MVQVEDLKRMEILRELEAPHLEKLATIAEKARYASGTVLFEHGQSLERFSLLLEGRVDLTLDVGGEEPLTVAEVEPGISFGISALIPGKRSASKAVCREVCTVIHLPRDQALELFDQNGELGCRFMYQVLRTFKSRMNQRTQQFLYCLETHPEMRDAIEELSCSIEPDSEEISEGCEPTPGNGD